MDEMFFQDLGDQLQEAADHLADDLDSEEAEGRRKVVKLCKDIAFDWDNHVKDDVEK